jgi:hypothetical protein
VCRQLNIADKTYYRWRREYGGLNVDQAKRMMEFEQENARLKRFVANRGIDMAILREAPRDTFQPAASCSESGGGRAQCCIIAKNHKLQERCDIQ